MDSELDWGRPEQPPAVHRRRVGHPHGDLTAEVHARRATSFGAVATAYAEHRPDYPAAAIRWALEPLAQPREHPQPREHSQPGNHRPSITILDLAAGTGKLTAQLADPALTYPALAQPATVIAVERDPLMLTELRRHVPQVPALVGSAEAIPLANRAVNAVFVGQAAHWFDLDRAMPELARVLRPGGVLAGLWNGHDDQVDWVAGLFDAVGHRSGVARTSWDQGAQDELTIWLGTHGCHGFGPPAHAGFSHFQLRTADSLIETLRTHSNNLTGDPEMSNANLAAMRRYLAAQPETRDGEFRLPLYTQVVRIIRGR